MGKKKTLKKLFYISRMCRIQQIEEIVASFSPSRNLLTKIVKKIHENLLCWDQYGIFETDTTGLFSISLVKYGCWTIKNLY